MKGLSSHEYLIQIDYLHTLNRISLLLIFLCLSVRSLSTLPKVAARQFELGVKPKSQLLCVRSDWPTHIPIAHAHWKLLHACGVGVYVWVPLLPQCYPALLTLFCMPVTRNLTIVAFLCSISVGPTGAKITIFVVK